VRSRLIGAIAASTLVIVAAPNVGQIRGAIQSALPGQYRLIIGGTIAAAIAFALLHAIVRIRERRLLRYGLIAAAIAGGTIYAWLTATGNANVDVVEHFHFVEYGAITLLFYRMWNDRANVTALLFPLLAGLIVGTADEAVQWLVPARVGELHDVLLDGVAVACGLIFSVGLQPPSSVVQPIDRHTRRGMAAFVCATIVIVAAFFHVVHLGYEIDGGDAGRFLSRFTVDELRDAEHDRGARWTVEAPSVLHRFSIEDHYLAEGVWHIQRRNEGTGLNTWKENLILERFFEPVLRFPTYSTPNGAVWPPEQRANVEVREAHDTSRYVSDANPYPIYAWGAVSFWLGAAGLIALVLLVMLGPDLLRR